MPQILPVRTQTSGWLSAISRCRGGRVLRPELLGGAAVGPVAENLRDLARINRLLGGHRLLTGILSELVAEDDRFTFLDVGTASGDMAAAVRARFRNARPVCVDRARAHLRASAFPCVVADGLQLPFRAASVDYVFCSLFMHEFSNAEVRSLMQRFHRVARRALIVLDLYRHPLAYHFLPATRWLFGWGDLTVHDGPISVEAGFKQRELARLAREAGIEPTRIRRHLPWFRISMVAEH